MNDSNINKGSEEGFVSIERRLCAGAIDCVVMLFCILLACWIPGDSDVRVVIRTFLLFAPPTIYNPLLTAYAATLGQYLTGIRIRTLNNPSKKISLGAAFGRWILAVARYQVFSKANQAALDKFVGTIVVKVRSPPIL